MHSFYVLSNTLVLASYLSNVQIISGRLLEKTNQLLDSTYLHQSNNLLYPYPSPSLIHILTLMPTTTTHYHHCS